jgi:hypothetical protein
VVFVSCFFLCVTTLLFIITYLFNFSIHVVTGVDTKIKVISHQEIRCILCSPTNLMDPKPCYSSEISEISAELELKMHNRSWRDDCPVQLTDLRHITVLHWNFEGAVSVGELIVHRKIAVEMTEIFRELFIAKFPIERIQLIDEYDADDERSMEANNTSAFCCREITNKPGFFSNHSYGIAIDINPLVNPYVKGDQVLPKSGAAYLDRSKSFKGLISDSPENPCFQAFVSRGYEWGGSWVDRIDYQHFSKQIQDVID